MSGALRKHAADAGLMVTAFLFGAVSLTYPYGRDQALYGYVAREWVERGSIPYRDLYDHKTPGIYLLHAITVLLMGWTPWGIRIAELICIGALGCLAARLATPRGQSIAPGLRGLSVLAGSIFYFGFFDYWNTAQSEIWYSTLGIAAVTAIAYDAKQARGQMIAGALGAAAMIMKPPAIWMVLIAAGVVVLRVRETREKWLPRAMVGLVRFGASFAVVVALTLGYFGIHHALGAMADIVIGANGYYVAHERGVQGLGDVFSRCLEILKITLGAVVPSIVLLVICAGGARRAKNRELRHRIGLGFALLVAAFLGVAMQQKFYLLHWVVIVGPLTVLATLALHELRTFDFFRARERFASLLLAGLIVVAYLASWFGGGPAMWAHANVRAYQRWTGALSHQDYTREFAIDSLRYHLDDVDNVSRWLNDHLRPDEDTVASRGFNPEIYLLTGRHYVGRFFWTTFLVEPHRAYRRAEYLAEDDAAFKKAPPRFVVTLSFVHEGLDSAEYYEPLGYHRVATFGTLNISERSL